MALSEAQRASEADNATYAYQAYTVWLLAGSVRQSLADWQVYVPSDTSELSQRRSQAWLTKATQATLGWRRAARKAGVAFFRLMEAISSQSADLPARRANFAQLEGFSSSGGAPLKGGPAAYIREIQRGAAQLSPAEKKAVDESQAEIDRLSALDAAQEKAEALEVEAFLQTSGSSDLAKRNAKISKDLADDKLAAELALNNERAAAGMAATSSRQALMGGRNAVLTLIKGGKPSTAWVRVSSTGNPCYFCLMLMSRGAIYASEESAGGMGTGHEYHARCACVGIPVFSRGDYRKSSVFDRNRELAALWKQVTKGTSGAESLRVWREHFKDQKVTEGQVPKTTAQEAA